MGSEEERVLEEQLELQLQEQRDSLSAIDQALLSDPSNPELLAVPSPRKLSFPLLWKQNKKFNLFNNRLQLKGFFESHFLLFLLGS